MLHFKEGNCVAHFDAKGTVKCILNTNSVN